MNKSKWIGIIILILIIIGSLQRIFNGDKIDNKNAERDSLTSVETNTISELEKNRIELKELIKNETKVLDFVLTEANVLYLSVKDDGTNRDGLAEYFCEKINSLKAVNKIKIVKYGSTKDPNKDNAYGILLGEKSCK